jgi:hypothetical protein
MFAEAIVLLVPLLAAAFHIMPELLAAVYYKICLYVAPHTFLLFRGQLSIRFGTNRNCE